MAASIHVVDDAPTIREVVRGVAESEGLSASGFATPAQFLASVASGTPALVLLDLAIGEQDGIGVLEALAGRNLGCSIIVMSGLDQRLLASAVRIGQALGLDMLEPLSKPFSLADLKRRLGRAAAPFRPLDHGDLERALSENELVPHYQPRICLRTMRPVGCESLVRWRHPSRGLLVPKEFMALAESSSHVTQMTYVMIQHALRDVARWVPAGGDFSVAVNVSARSLVEPGFAERVLRILSDSSAAPQSLTLEATETAAMAHTTTTAGCLTRLRIKGVSLSLDDFGTGYCSLVELHRLPFTEIKIDQSFVTGMETDADARVIVRAIIGLAQTLGMRSVAEGMQTAGALRLLRDMGADFAQGYHIARPMPADAFATWLRDWRPPQASENVPKREAA